MKNFLVVFVALAALGVVVECQNVTSSNWDKDLCPNYRGRQRPFKCLAEFSGIDCNGQTYKKYFFIPRNCGTSWYKAQALCKAFGFDFATFGSLNEFSKVSNIMVAYQDLLTEYVHVGGMTTLALSRTEWYWADTDSKIDFTIPWSTGEPNNGDGKEFCLSVGPRANYCFNDNKCGSETSFLCQKVIYDYDNCRGCGR